MMASFKVEKVVCAVDSGIAVNPDVIVAQMEGGIGYALGRGAPRQDYAAGRRGRAVELQ